tara:strand:+ start:610 stop:1227 length:618 start_codon:yes stop_codon:yes gene_type:complete
MFDPHDTKSVVEFVNQYVSNVQNNASTATGVQKLMHKIDDRVQRRRDAKQLLKLTANQLVDAGWTRHDVAASNVRWGKMLKQHGASNLVRTLKMTLQDATEMGMTAKQLLGMTSDLLAEWNVSATDMISLGATVPQLLDRYETAENMLDMGFSRDIMVQLGMKADRADAMFGASARPQTQACAVQSVPSPSLETVTVDNNTSLDF